MKLSTEQRREVDLVMRTSVCPKSFECAKSDFDDLCTVRLHEDTGLIECIDSKNKGCEFCARFDGSTSFCCCRMRAHLLKKLGV